MPGSQQFPERTHQARDVIKVQAAGGFIEQEQTAFFRHTSRRNAAARRRGQVTGQFQPLRFAARQGGYRLPKFHIFQTHVSQGAQPPLHIAQAGEKVQRLAYGHVQDVVNGRRTAQVFNADFQNFRPEAFAIAVGAAQIDVRQELHFDVFEPRAAAGGTAPVATVEAECAGRIAAFFGKFGLCKQLADGVECADITGRIRTCRFPDRGLVNHHHIGQLFGPQQVVELARRLGGFALTFQQGRIQHVLDQGGLARARYPADAHQPAQGNGDRHIFQIVGAYAFQQQFWGGRLYGQGARRLDAQPVAQIVSGQGIGLAQLLR